MSRRLEKHHDISLKILVLRSLSGESGEYGDFDDLGGLIAEERILWASLTDHERLTEQEFLAALWRNKNGERIVRARELWGAEWPETVEISDRAFTLSPEACSGEVHSGFETAAAWLRARGFRVERAVAPWFIDISVPARRIAAEADRLLSLLAREFGCLEFGTTCRIVGKYDPVSGKAFIELYGLGDHLWSD